MMAMATTATHAHRGRKRPAADTLEADHRLSKRFNLLNIHNSGKLYISVAASSSPSPSSSSSSSATAAVSHTIPDPNPSRTAPIQSQVDDWMQLEDTKDKVYIYNLDEELARLESDEKTPFFLSDIEKHLAKIPQHVLANDTKELQRSPDNQLVLYRPPVFEDEGSIRKAIIEASNRPAKPAHPRAADHSPTESAPPPPMCDAMAIDPMELG